MMEKQINQMVNEPISDGYSIHLTITHCTQSLRRKRRFKFLIAMVAVCIIGCIYLLNDVSSNHATMQRQIFMVGAPQQQHAKNDTHTQSSLNDTQTQLQSHVNNPSNTVLLFTNFEYMKITEIWLKYFQLIPQTEVLQYNVELLIVCMDNKSFDHISQMYPFKSHNLSDFSSCSNIYEIDSRPAIWTLRLCVIIELLARKDSNSILLTDSDAIWLKNPYPYLLDPLHQNIDFMATGGPHPPGHQHNPKMKYSALIMGFIFINNTHKNQKIFDEAYAMCLNETEWVCDDQVKVNAAITSQYKGKITFFNESSADDDDHDSEDTLKLLYLEKPQFCRKSCGSVARNPRQKEKIIVFHPITNKGCALKVNTMKRYGIKL